MKRFLIAFTAGILPAFLLLLSIQTSLAGSATWKANPATGDWNRAANWMPQTIPNGPSDTATFATSNRTAVSLSASTEVDGIVFNAGASAFTITVPGNNLGLTFSGVGIANNSGITQNFVTVPAGGAIAFINSATAGSGTVFTNNGDRDRAFGGETEFIGSSSAGGGTFINNGPTGSGFQGGKTLFFSTSTAGDGNFTTNGAAHSGKDGGIMRFSESSTAANGTFTFNGGAVSGAGGGFLQFFDSSTADNATVIANGSISGAFGGTIQLLDNSSGGTARFKLFGNGELDISFHNGPVTTGSIEGSGLVFLGSNDLIIGGNNLNTTFSGIIQDGGLNGGAAGSLTKIGDGKLVLNNANTYTGGTIVNDAKLIINNHDGSGTGGGPVHVEGGTLGGNGTIAGEVIVGTRTGRHQVRLDPGSKRGFASIGTLTIQSALTFNSNARFEIGANSSNVIADKVVANGVAIKSGAVFSFFDFGSGTLSAGTVFSVINNTSANPIAGTFSNLADGSTFTSNGNTYQVNYEGGDGNDLTLTVRP